MIFIIMIIPLLFPCYSLNFFNGLFFYTLLSFFDSCFSPSLSLLLLTLLLHFHCYYSHLPPTTISPFVLYRFSSLLFPYICFFPFPASSFLSSSFSSFQFARRTMINNDTLLDRRHFPNNTNKKRPKVKKKNNC